MNKIIKTFLLFLLIINFIFIQTGVVQAACCAQNQPALPCPQQPCCPAQTQNTTCCPSCPTCPSQPQICEPPSVVEHLPTYKGSSVNMVKISTNSATIQANNVLKVTISGDFNSKKVCPNDKISFILNEGLTTVEGRQLLP